MATSAKHNNTAARPSTRIPSSDEVVLLVQIDDIRQTGSIPIVRISHNTHAAIDIRPQLQHHESGLCHRPFQQQRWTLP
jgi:hypothetical protein